MHRIDNSTAVAGLPAPAPIGTPGFFTGGNKPTGLAPTRVDDDWCNSVQEEIANVVLAAGLQLSKVSNTQLYEAIQAIAYGANPDLSAYLPLSGGTLSNPGNLTVNGNALIGQGLSVNVDLVVGGNANFGSAGVIGAFTAVGASSLASTRIYQPATSDPLTVAADPGHFARIRSTVTGVRQWSVGAAGNGDFLISDDTLSQTRLLLGTTGSAATNGNFGVLGGVFFGLTNGAIGAGDLAVFNQGGATLVVGRFNQISGSVDQVIATFDTNFINGGNLLVNGNAFKPTGPEWGTIADTRLKKDIQDYERGLETVRQLRPVTYRWNGLGDIAADGTLYHGLIAQEIVDVMPEMLTQQPIKLRADDAESTSIYAMNRSPLTYALVNAVRELADRVEALEAAAARPLPA